MTIAAAPVLLSPGAAAAADIYAGAPGGGYKDEPFYAVNSWAGFYLGTNGGGAWSSQNGSLNITATGAGGVSNSASAKVSPAGVFGGAQIGYNWQRDGLVLGVEADLDSARVYDKPSSTVVSAPPAATGGAAAKAELLDFGTARLRAGYSFGSLLVYGSGGFAFGSTQDRLGAGVSGGGGGSVTGSSTATGWAAGGGFQYAFTPALSWKLEYLHIDLGSTSEMLALPSATANLTVHHEYDIVRTGVNYRLGTNERPAIADVYTSLFESSGSVKDVPAYLAPWAGFYGGWNTASAYSEHEGTLTATAAGSGSAATGSVKESPSGWSAGAQIGYNWQFGRYVLGVEADVNGGAGIQDRAFVSETSGPAISQAAAKSDLDYFGTLRGRAGYTIGRFLVYGTGGFAFGGVRDHLSITNVNGATGSSSAASNGSSETATGWAAGAGFEIALSPSWSLKTEYLHLGLGSTTLTEAAAASPGAAPGSATLTVQHDYDVVRGGVNYHFGSYEPLK